MGLFDGLVLGLQVAFSPTNLLYCLFGVTLGTAIGVLPGVGPLVTISLLLPLTFGVPPEAALIMLAGIYYGAAYGGSTTSILVNLPGESSSAVTCIDGYQMARQGRAGPALAIAAIGSFVAGTFGTLLVVVAGPAIASVALEFGAAEYTSLIVLALIATAALASGGLVKGAAMGLLGVLFGLVGADVTTGALRFTFGLLDLNDGVDFVVVAVGLFALTEIIFSAGRANDAKGVEAKVDRLVPSRQEVRLAWPAVLRGTAVGAFFGALPGAGQVISSFAAYMLEKNIARDPSRFGNGAVEGVAAPESANNAASQTAFIPTLTLGIPGSPVMTLMLGALLIQGIAPGPRVITDYPNLFWGLVVSMWIGNLLLVILNLPLVGIWIKVLRIPYQWLFLIVLGFACIGVYSVHASGFDVMLTAFFGLLGYVLLKAGCSPSLFILGLVLGPKLEENFRRAMLISDGDPTVFFTSPISLVCLAAALILIVAMLVPSLRRSRDAISAG
jgi:putative tricarboxylic transport membrane protein